MFRKVGGVVLGMVTAMVVIMGIESLGHMVFPPPEGLNAQDSEQIIAYLEVIPPGALLFVIAAWCIGAFLGGLVAARICGRPYLYAGIICGVILLGTILNLVTLPHPLWFSITAVILIPLMAWPAAKLGRPAF